MVVTVVTDSRPSSVETAVISRYNLLYFIITFMREKWNVWRWVCDRHVGGWGFSLAVMFYVTGSRLRPREASASRVRQMWSGNNSTWFRIRINVIMKCVCAARWLGTTALHWPSASLSPWSEGDIFLIPDILFIWTSIFKLLDFLFTASFKQSYICLETQTHTVYLYSSQTKRSEETKQQVLTLSFVFSEKLMSDILSKGILRS